MNGKAKIYIIMSLLITWVLTIYLYSGDKLLKYIGLIMFVPAITALVIRIVTEGFTLNIIRNPDAKGFVAFLKALAFAIIFVIAFISVICFAGAVMYDNKIDGAFIQSLYNSRIMLKALTIAAISISALGEEYGWRAFLLPELSKTMSRVKASFIVGVVWALFHIPVVYLLTLKSNVGNPYLVALVQGVAALTLGFAFCYCYFISNRVYPCVIFHGFWNALNPYALGSIYIGMSGVVLKNANVFIANGEGVLGAILGAVLIPLFIPLIRKTEKRDKKLSRE